MKRDEAALRAELTEKNEQSAMAIPGYEQQQCSHFPLVTHDAAKDAFVDNVKKLNAVMTFPT